MTTPSTTIATAVASVLAANCATAYEDVGAWRRLADMPAARQEMPAVYHQGRIYVPGGMDANSCCNALGKFEAYDISADQWTTLPDIPILANHMGAAALNGKIYVFGGWTGGTDSPASNKAFAYDILSETWSNLPDMIEGAAGSGVVQHGGKIYVFGGSTQSAFDKNGSKKVKEYDPATNTWTTVNSDMPFGRCHIGAGLIGTKAYISPGRPGRLSASDDDVVQEFDFTRMNEGAVAWRVMNPMPAPTRTGFMSSWPMVNGKLYYIGGEGNHYGITYATVHEFTPDAGGGTYREVNPYPIPVHGIGPVAVGAKIYVCGGASSGGVGNKQKVVHVFDLNVMPEAPSALTASMTRSTEIELTWADNSNNEDNFLVQRAGDPAGPWTDLPLVAANLTTTTDSGLTPSTQYYHRVRAHNSHGDSAFSALVATTTLRVVDDWLSAHGLTVADFVLDTDHDGLRVGVEYALGLEPNVFDSGKAPALSMATGEPALVFSRPKPAPADIDYLVEVSTTLQSWLSGDGFTWPEEVTDNLDGTETVTVRIRTLPGGVPAEFTRLKIVLN